ncbi:MAG: hypothetical protein ACJAWS_001906 [Oleiphilaceae bacterium]|jgi:hypothetical protein
MSDSRYNYLKGDYFISAASLLLEYRSFIDSHPVLFKMNVANACWPQLVMYCEELAQNENIMRSITCMHTHSQIEFERALFCSWGSLVVAGSLNLDKSHQQALFYAGLLQDIGEYALSADITVLNSNSVLPFFTTVPANDENMHALQGSSYVESLLPDLSSVGDLILHHHARDDGTGYPSHVGESQLSLDNQILIVANEISDRLDQLGGHNQALHLIPSLKLGQLLYFTKAQNAWLKILEQHICQSLVEPDVYTSDDLKLKGVKLEKLMSCLLCVSGDLLPYDFNLEVHGLRIMIRKLASLFVDSGIFDVTIFEGTEQISAEMMLEINSIFKGMPEILTRCLKLVDEILGSKKYDSNINVSLLSECRALLHRNIKSLDTNRCSIFR